MFGNQWHKWQQRTVQAQQEKGAIMVQIPCSSMIWNGLTRHNCDCWACCLTLQVSFPEWGVMQEKIQQLAMLHRQEVEVDQVSTAAARQVSELDCQA